MKNHSIEVPFKPLERVFRRLQTATPPDLAKPMGVEAKVLGYKFHPDTGKPHLVTVSYRTGDRLSVEDVEPSKLYESEEQLVGEIQAELETAISGHREKADKLSSHLESIRGAVKKRAEEVVPKEDSGKACATG